ncbi:MAG: SGNH/GDSL hydrolase family protein [candidate division KSB1 bacterium]|nr:SGNH/GDSL hydrolase family protein [candidate division KSB1 bacterium]MDZ7302667.1 SGNH/GDSL hydrolase family protein [candidate division KSB1 bacterium]MDZ7311803.1 SGNH/GDSL hydrolase family protein [candidate division KSB1 bacterium]
MKKFSPFLILLGLLLWIGCEVKTPEQPSLSITKNQLVLSKMVAIGNSLTAGFQSSGLVEDFQLKSYPYLIAQQLGKAADFQMPLIAKPGIGSTAGKTPLKLQGGQIVADNLTVDPRTLLKNATLARPYDNLAVPGATLGDVLTATSSTTSASGSNPFFDMVLRNPNFGNTSQLQQAILLNPTLIMLWIGNNDVLASALAGGNPALITSQANFQTRFTTLLTQLRQNTRAAIVMANIPYVTDIPYVNTLDIIFRTIPALGITSPVPVIFDTKFQPVDFDPSANVLYIPLLTEETQVVHLTLPALSLYQTGVGVPNAAVLTSLGVPAEQAQALEQGMKAAGLNPTGQKLPNTVSITVTENNTIKQAVDGFNSTLQTLATQFQVPIVNANAMLTTLNTSGMDGYSGKFVLLDPANTAFSLDGVHPNNGGYALVANAFIEKINTTFGLAIPKLNPASYKGQYTGGTISEKIALEAVEQVKAIF